MFLLKLDINLPILVRLTPISVWCDNPAQSYSDFVYWTPLVIKVGVKNFQNLRQKFSKIAKTSKIFKIFFTNYEVSSFGIRKSLSKRNLKKKVQKWNTLFFKWYNEKRFSFISMVLQLMTKFTIYFVGNRLVVVAVKDITISAWSLGFDSQAGQTRHSVDIGLPPQRSFFGPVLSGR